MNCGDPLRNDPAAAWRARQDLRRYLEYLKMMLPTMPHSIDTLLGMTSDAKGCAFGDDC